MIDFDKMTVAEHEQYKEMERKVEAFDFMCDKFERYFPMTDEGRFIETNESAFIGAFMRLKERMERTD